MSGTGVADGDLVLSDGDFFSASFWRTRAGGERRKFAAWGFVEGEIGVQ